MTAKKEREEITGYINDTVNSGARKKEACKITGITLRTLQRWKNNPDGDKRPDFKRKSPQALIDPGSESGMTDSQLLERKKCRVVTCYILQI